MWEDAETAYFLNIITESEENSLQQYAQTKADGIRYTHDHLVKTFFNNVLEFAIFDIALGDFDGGTVYAADKGRNLINTKINGEMVRLEDVKIF